MFYPVDAIERAFTYSTTVGVVDKLTVDDGINTPIYQMVYNAIGEIGSENLAHYRLMYNKSYTETGFVFPLVNIRCQLHETLLLIHLKPELVVRIALVFAGLQVR
jgi:hypothetical protein